MLTDFPPHSLLLMLLSRLPARVLSPSSLPTTAASLVQLLLLLLLLVLLLCHPGRELIAIVVVDWSVVGLSLLLLMMARRQWRTERRNSLLFRGIDMGIVFNLKGGHCT